MSVVETNTVEAFSAGVGGGGGGGGGAAVEALPFFVCLAEIELARVVSLSSAEDVAVPPPEEEEVAGPTKVISRRRLVKRNVRSWHRMIKATKRATGRSSVAEVFRIASHSIKSNSLAHVYISVWKF